MNRWAIALIVLLLGFDPPPAHAGTRIVDPANGPYYTIQAALDEAVGGDTVEVVAGVYPESLHPSTSITLRSRSGPAETILDGQGAHRILELGAIALNVRGFTFLNGMAEGGGGAIYFHTGDLDVRECVFRGNRATTVGQPWRSHAWGGAILAGYGTTGLYSNCLFTGNHNTGTGWLEGEAVSIGEYPWDGASAGADPARLPSVRGQRFIRCSFVRNRAESGESVLSSEVPIEVRNCLFVDRGNSESFIVAREPSVFACNMLFDRPSPQVEGTWPKAVAEGDFIDPMICPNDSLALHALSPARTGWGLCDGAGNLPIGCDGPAPLAVRPLHLEPLPDQAVRIFGYGLDEVLEARLQGPAGAMVPSKGRAVDGKWLTVYFDLSNQPPGEWTLVLRTALAGDVSVDTLKLSPVQIWGFRDGWIADPVLYEGVVIGRNLIEGITLELQHGDDGPLLPIEVTGLVGSDSLHVRVDLRVAEQGSQDLLVQIPGGQSYRVEAAMFLGAPPIVRVPEDYPTITEALDAAAACSEIDVAPGIYHESLIIRKPVRLRATGEQAYLTRIEPGAAHERVLHILPEAGVLTEIDGFRITEGRAAGPGGGVFCEAPALIRGNWIDGNQASGPGGRGGGICAPAGARIIDNDLSGNTVGTYSNPGDLWSTGPETGGVAGGIFCLHCLVEGNSLDNNYAETAGGTIAEGAIRRNAFLYNSSERNWMIGAFRGEIRENHFDNCCGTRVPYMVIEGPAVVAENRFTDTSGDLCGYFDSIYLRGSIDLRENVFWNVGVQACLITDDLREPHPGHFRMEGNFFSEAASVDLDLAGADGACVNSGPIEPRSPMSPDSIGFACNMQLPGAHTWYVANGMTLPCTDCVHAPGQMPPGCPDTVAVFHSSCPTPSFPIQSSGCEATVSGVRLYWNIPPGNPVDGFDLFREAGGRKVKLNEERIGPCLQCEFVDRSPPLGEGATYDLLVYVSGVAAGSYHLGEWDGLGAPSAFHLAPPIPNPVRGDALLRFDLPQGGGRTRLAVVDLLGRDLTVLFDGPCPGGMNEVRWGVTDGSGRPLASGVYLLRLTWGARTCNRAFVVLH